MGNKTKNNDETKQNEPDLEAEVREEAIRLRALVTLTEAEDFKPKEGVEYPTEEEVWDLEDVEGQISNFDVRGAFRSCSWKTLHLMLGLSVEPVKGLTEEQVKQTQDDGKAMLALLNRYPSMSVPRSDGRTEEALVASMQKALRATLKPEKVKKDA